MKRAKKLSKKIVSVAVASTIIMTASVTAFATDYTRLDRISQPKVSHNFAKDELGVVNFKSTWGDKEANVSSMLNYVEQAHEKGVKILLFPEMCVTGYVSSSDPESLAYQTAVNLAETSDGPTATTFAGREATFIATTEGSLITMPLPLTNTRVFAVPRSIPIS